MTLSSRADSLPQVALANQCATEVACMKHETETGALGEPLAP